MISKVTFTLVLALFGLDRTYFFDGSNILLSKKCVPSNERKKRSHDDCGDPQLIFQRIEHGLGSLITLTSGTIERETSKQSEKSRHDTGTNSSSRDVERKEHRSPAHAEFR